MRKKKEDENNAKEEQIRKHIKYLIKYKYIKKILINVRQSLVLCNWIFS